MDKEIVLAADLGGTNLRMAAVDRQGTILCRAGRDTPPGENLAEIVRAIIETAVECRENCADFKVAAMAAAVPGTLDVKAFNAFVAAEIEQWTPIVRASGARAD